MTWDEDSRSWQRRKRRHAAAASPRDSSWIGLGYGSYDPRGSNIYRYIIPMRAQFA